MTVTVARSEARGAPGRAQRSVEETNRWMLRARDAIDRDYAKPLDIPTLARIALVSEAHFIRTFRQVFGETPHRYLQRRRIERAMALLRHTDRPVTDISLAVGFSSLGTFSRTFQAVVGESPSSYRRRSVPTPVPTCSGVRPRRWPARCGVRLGPRRHGPAPGDVVSGIGDNGPTMGPVRHRWSSSHRRAATLRVAAPQAGAVVGGPTVPSRLRGGGSGTERLRLMAVHAHPDDESSKGAATMARYVAEGVSVLVVTCTGGERGSVLNPKLDRPEIRDNIAEIRRQEMATARAILGVEQEWL